MKKILFLIATLFTFIFTSLTVFSEENMLTPSVNGQKPDINEIVISADSNIYRVNGIEKSYDKSLGTAYIDENGKFMLPVSALLIITGEQGANIYWNDTLNQAYIYYDDNKELGIKNQDIVFTVNNNIVFEKELGRLMSGETVLKDGQLYIPLKDVLDVFHIKESDVTYDFYNKTLSIKRKLSFDTDKITIMTAAKSGKKRAYINITDSNIIDKITRICMSGSFSDTAEKKDYVCDYIVDFNNGTSIGIYSDNEGSIGNGYNVYGSQKLPEGLFEAIHEISTRYSIYIDSIENNTDSTVINLMVNNTGLSEISYTDEVIVEVMNYDEDGDAVYESIYRSPKSKEFISQSKEKRIFSIKLHEPLEKGTYKVTKYVNNDKNLITFKVD